MSDREDVLWGQLGTYDPGVDASGSLINDTYCGRTSEHYAPPTTAGKTRSNQAVIRTIAVRNMTGGAVLPSRAYSLKTDASTPEGILKAVSGVTATSGQSLIVVADPWLPTAGVPANGIFYGVVKGLIDVYTPTLQATFNGNIVVGEPLVATVGGAFGNTAAPADVTAAQRMADNYTAKALKAQTAASDLAIKTKVMLDVRYIP